MLQLARLGPGPAYFLAWLSAAFGLSILAYDASMINNLNILSQYTSRKYYEQKLIVFTEFGLDASLIGLNTAIVSVGSIVAGPFVGPLVDRFGRRAGLAVGSVLVLLGAALQSTATKEVQFVIGRFFIGMAQTINGTTSPMWMMELASPRNRTFLVSAVVICLPMSGLVAICITFGLYQSDSNWAWRGPILGEALPGAICLLALLFADESPRWLIYQGSTTEALEVITRLHANGDSQDVLVAAEFKEICDTLEFEKNNKAGWKSLIEPGPNLRRFLIVVLCNVFYQIVGAQMILYFFTLIVQQAGITDLRQSFLINIGIAIWASLWVGSGGWIVNRIGRKTALVYGAGLMTLCLALLSVLGYLNESRGGTSYSIGAIVVVFVFQIASCSTWLNLAYTYPPEILSYSQRAKGVAAAQAIGFAVSFLNLYTTPIALANISWRYYAINAGWNVVIVVAVQWLFVETAGKTLEEVDEIFDGRVHTDGVHIGTGKVLVIDGVESGVSKEEFAKEVKADE